MLEIDKVYVGDCLEVMSNIEDGSIDMVLCDLPYGITSCKWDTPINLDMLWEQYNRIVKDKAAIVLTATQPFTSRLVMSNPEMFRYTWVWEKTQATGMFNANRQPLRAHEDICIFYKKQPTYHPQKTHGHKPMNSGVKRKEVINKSTIYGKVKKDVPFGGNTDRFPRTVITFKSDKQTNYLHPTQKPVALGKYLIRTYTDEGDLVLDNCCGSGSFLVSATQENRRFIGIEKEEHYCDIARARLF